MERSEYGLLQLARLLATMQAALPKLPTNVKDAAAADEEVNYYWVDANWLRSFYRG